jgi:hypothetical protein
MPIEHHDDPAGVFEASAAAIEADARKILRRAGIYSPTAEQIEAARESARLEYSARAADALRTGSVRP